MNYVERFIELTKQANEAGIAGDHHLMMSFLDKRLGFGECWEMSTGGSYGHLLTEADLAMAEIYGDVDMCGGVLNHFSAHKKTVTEGVTQ